MGRGAPQYEKKHVKLAGGSRSHVEMDQDESHNAGRHLHGPDLARGRSAAIQPSHDDKQTEECSNLSGELGHWMDEPPCQPGGEEAVVEALVCGQRPCLRRKLGGEAECFATSWRRPQEHFQNHDVQVEKGEDSGGRERKEGHLEGGWLCWRRYRVKGKVQMRGREENKAE